MASDPRDLFGWPVAPGYGLQGRPRHAPTPELRERVAQLKAGGLSHLQIAAAIGITGPTLRLNYRDELNSNSQTNQRRVARDNERNGQ